MRSLLAGVALALCGATEARAQDSDAGGLGFGERTELFGRLGLRYQGELGAPSGDDSVHRARLEARVGLRLRAAHWVYAVVRLRAASAGGDRRDGFLELGDALETASVALDRAHLRLQFDRVPELSVAAGIVEHPIAGAAPLSWDRDLAPAGIAGSYDRRLRSIPVSIRPAGFAYLIRSDAEGSPASMFGGQLGATLSWPLFDLALTGAAIGFDDASPLATGNSTDAFTLVSGTASLELHLLARLPLSIDGALITNTGGARGQRLAWSAQITAGRLDWTGDFEVTYRYRDVDLDAVPAALPADDYRLATGVRGHDLIAVFQITERLTAGASAFVYRAATDGAGREARVRVDVTAAL